MRELIVTLTIAFLACPGTWATSDIAPGAIPGGSSSSEGSFPIVAYFGLGMNDYCVGVGFDGTYFWVSAGDQQTGTCEFYVLDDAGNLIDHQPQGGGANGWGHRDLCWDGDFMFGSYSDLVDGFSDPATFSGYFIGPISPCRALAFTGVDFYTCGFSENLWKMTWDGAWGSAAAVEDLGGPWDGIYGLAYDCGANCLWMTTADYSGNLYKLGLDGVLFETYTTLPEYEVHGGCTMADCQWGHVLCILSQSPGDVLVLYDVGSGPSPVQDASWGEIKNLFK